MEKVDKKGLREENTEEKRGYVKKGKKERDTTEEEGFEGCCVEPVLLQKE